MSSLFELWKYILIALMMLLLVLFDQLFKRSDWFRQKVCRYNSAGNCFHGNNSSSSLTLCHKDVCSIFKKKDGEQ